MIRRPSPTAPRGQTLLLFGLTMLLLVVMVCMTLAIGAQAKKKLELQTVAETAAYSNAIATARAYNAASLMNRTMVSHWVAMAGNLALVSWVTEIKGDGNAFAGMVREFEKVNPSASCANGTGGYPNGNGPTWYGCPDAYDPPGPGACGNATTAIRDASYEWWHMELSLWHPVNGVTPGDDVNGNCKGGNCTSYRPWISQGWGELDARAALQTHQIHDTIMALAEVERNTWLELRDTLDPRGAPQPKITAQLLRASQGQSTSGARLPRDYSVEGVIGRQQVAWREAGIDAATQSSNGDDTHEQAMAMAVMGTRAGQYLTNPSPQVFPINGSVIPRRLRSEMAQITSWLNANYNGAWRFSIRPGIVSAFPSRKTTDPSTELKHPWDPADWRQMNWRSFVGLTRDDARDQELTAQFNPSKVGCPGGWKTNKRDRGDSLQVSNHNDDAHHQWGHGPEVTSHARWPMRNGPDVFTTCHQFHTHYDERDDERLHQLEDVVPGGANEGGHRPDILPGLGFVFPQSSTKDGAAGAWGQPKIPAVVSFTNTRANASPWDLTVDFELDGQADTAKVDLGAHSGVDNDTVALANAMAYYHHRGQWIEGPNMLNPFWRATLVPIAVDEKPAGSAAGDDNSPRARTRIRRPDVPAMLNAGGHSEYADAYNRLISSGFKGLR